MSTPDTDIARRAFWTARMDEGYAFMQAITRHPVTECGERILPLAPVAEAAGAEVAYSSTWLDTGLAHQFILREGLLPAFTAVARDLNRHGMVLKVEDAYRDRVMQKRLGLKPALLEKIGKRLLWELGGARLSPEFVAKRIAALIAHCPETGTHMSGSAMDISVLRRSDRSELDRGASYLEISELTPMDSPFVTPENRRNREFITDLMAAHGFVPYPFEFWHYSSGDVIAEVVGGGGKTARYGAVDLRPDGGVTPLAHPLESLNSPEVLAAALDDVLKQEGCA